MTVVAWDGVTLAADKMSLNNYHANVTCKVRKVDGCLVAFTGNHDAGMEMLHWFSSGAEPNKFPHTLREDTSGTALIAIRPDGNIWRYENTPFPLILKDKFYAAGCGRDYALMAMHLGKTARQAVALTCELCVACGMGIDQIRF